MRFVQGNKMFAGQYFYQPEETVMGADATDDDGNEFKKVQVPQLNKRLFLSTDEDNDRCGFVHIVMAYSSTSHVHTSGS